MGDNEKLSAPNEPRSAAVAAAVGKFQFLQPSQDFHSNLEVDYLFKICSDEATDTDYSVNCVKSALPLQGSILVYSQKIECLYLLVLMPWSSSPRRSNYIPLCD